MIRPIRSSLSIDCLSILLCVSASLRFHAFLFILAAFGTSADAAWRAGSARADITPSEPTYLAGYASRESPFDGVVHPLWAKALVLEDGAGKRVAIVTCDLVGMRSAVIEPVCQRITEATKIPRADILINCSHTHTGPLVLSKIPAEYASNEILSRSVDYKRKLEDTLADLVIRAASDLQPATLSAGLGVATFVMNRREATREGVKLGVNPRGLVDRGVPVVRIDAAGGKPLAILFGAACHNTTLTGEHMQICGDYAGFAQIDIERRFDGAQAMFIQGCGGDANPYPRGTLELARLHGAALAEEVTRVAEGQLAPIESQIATAFRVIDAPLAPTPPRELLVAWSKSKSGWQAYVGRSMLKNLDEGRPAARSIRYPISVWRLGDRATLVGLSGEVVVDYVRLIEQAVGPRDLWVTAYCHDVFGYVPSRRVLAEGGYETRGVDTGAVGLFAPEAEDAIVAAVAELAREVGREPSE